MPETRGRIPIDRQGGALAIHELNDFAERYFSFLSV